MVEANIRQILPTKIHCQNENKNKIITWTCFFSLCHSSSIPYTLDSPHSFLFTFPHPYPARPPPPPLAVYLCVCLSFPLAVLSFGRCSDGFWHAINIACLRFPWLQPIFNLLMEPNLASLLQHFIEEVFVWWTICMPTICNLYTHTKHRKLNRS